jgi:hypothetical protein
MTEQELKIHRTWVQLLVDGGQKEAAAIAIDTEVFITYQGKQEYKDEGDWISRYAETVEAELHFPTSSYGYIKINKQLKEILEQTLRDLLQNRTLTFYVEERGDYYDIRAKVEVLNLVHHVRLIDVEHNWKDTVRALIAASKGVNNQGATTEYMFLKDKKEPILYEGLKFASQSEVRIAQELKQRKVLFFPLAVGVRAGTGQQFKDQREVDFLVCYNGAWGILEVSGPSHNGRFAVDAEKDGWFKEVGILCVEHRTAEQCFNNPKKVIDEFLSVLAKYKR